MVVGGFRCCRSFLLLVTTISTFCNGRKENKHRHPNKSYARLRVPIILGEFILKGAG